MATGTSHVDQVVVVPADIKRGACSTIIFSLSDGSKVPAIVQYLQDYEEGSVINVRYIGDNKAFVTHVVYDKKTYEKVRAQYVKHMAESKPEKAGKCPNGSDNIGVSTSREDDGTETTTATNKASTTSRMPIEGKSGVVSMDKEEISETSAPERSPLSRSPSASPQDLKSLYKISRPEGGWDAEYSEESKEKMRRQGKKPRTKVLLRAELLEAAKERKIRGHGRSNIKRRDLVALLNDWEFKGNSSNRWDGAHSFTRLIESLIHPKNIKLFEKRHRKATKDELTARDLPEDQCYRAAALLFNDKTFHPVNRFSKDVTCSILHPDEQSAIPQTAANLKQRWKAIRERYDVVHDNATESGTNGVVTIDLPDFIKLGDETHPREEHLQYLNLLLYSDDYNHLLDGVLSELEDDKKMSGDTKLNGVPEGRKYSKKRKRKRERSPSVECPSSSSIPNEKALAWEKEQAKLLLLEQYEKIQQMVKSNPSNERLQRVLKKIEEQMDLAYA
mmetsp:Transcript_7037/g.10747  ORF Transcript_7037/g.10747 Transcript_7037/m.10747 type:complete len:503 (+) Transcript_7037:136-1644(+)